jgi:hypothetical protein
MTYSRKKHRLAAALLAAAGIMATPAPAQNPGPRLPGAVQPANSPSPPARGEFREPVARVAEAPMQRPPEEPQRAAAPQQAAVQEHPLEPVLKMAYSSLNQIDKSIVDYKAMIVKRERINGKLNEYEYIATKIRHKPFSVYMYFVKPQAIQGREVIYIAGKNDGKLIGHEGTGIKKLAPGVWLAPDSAMAMRGQRYPITEVGIRTLTRRLIEVGEQDKQFGECEVKYFKGAKVQDRACTCLQVVHPVPRKNFRFNIARVYIDDDLQIPIRYESFDWPQSPGQPPILLEEYTYMNLQLNVGLTDADFDPTNPNYKF